MTHRGFLICCATLLANCASPQEEPVQLMVAVRVAEAQEADLQLTVQAPASVFPREQAKIAARLTAPIRRLVPRKGDSVRQGQILAELADRDLKAQRREAAAAVRAEQARIGRILAGTLPTEVEKAKGQVATTQAALSQAEKFYQRRKRLFEQGAIPNRDLLISQTELTQAKARHKVARRSLELLQGESAERDIQIARSRLEQARARLAVIEVQLGFTKVRSPFAGTITEQFLFSGDLARPNTPLFSLADLSVAVVRAQVPESDAQDVRRGAACSFSPTDRPNAALAGRVSVINQAVDAARRTVEVWCDIPNGDLRLRASVFGSLRIVTGTRPGAIIVPLEAVLFEEGTRQGFVMVVGEDRKARKRPVEAGPRSGAKVLIEKGLEKGDRVIVEGGYGLPDGTQVTWTEAVEKQPEAQGK